MFPGLITCSIDVKGIALHPVAFHPSFQKRGYGKKLVNKAIIELKKIGCLKVNLQVRESNASVTEFYKHLGFEVEERISFGMRLKNRIIE